MGTFKDKIRTRRTAPHGPASGGPPSAARIGAARSATASPYALGVRGRLGLQRRLAVESRSQGADHTLVLSGSLELDSLATFDAAVRSLWSGDVRSITIDLRDLAFIDSSGLWSITSLNKWCKRESIRLDLLRGPDPVQRVFDITGLSDVLPFVAA